MKERLQTHLLQLRGELDAHRVALQVEVRRRHEEQQLVVLVVLQKQLVEEVHRRLAAVALPRESSAPPTHESSLSSSSSIFPANRRTSYAGNMSFVVSAGQRDEARAPMDAMISFTLIRIDSASSKRHCDMRQLASITRPSTLLGQSDSPCVMQPSQFCSAPSSSLSSRIHVDGKRGYHKSVM